MSGLLEVFARSLRDAADVPGLELGGEAEPAATLSFGQLQTRARRMAGALAGRGLRAGDRLALQLGNRLETIELFLAGLRLGLVLVPVNVLYRERELAHLVTDAEPAAVVTTPDLAPLLPSGTVAWDVGALAAEAARRVPEPSPPLPGDAAPALIVYTSGTTGRAKGAVLSHGNLEANARTLLRAWRITDRDRYLGVLPLFHVHGLANGVCCWLASGCRLRLAPRFEHERALALFEAFRPTLFFGVPTVYVRLLELPEDAARSIGARARLFVSGSAPLPAHVFEAFRRRFGHEVLERYGMTETLMTVGNPYDGERRPGTVGLPLAAVEVRVVDAEGRDVRDGTTGELRVRGPAVFAGYWRRPDATAAAFDAAGFFRTGDLASRGKDGYLTLHGRASELILCGGFNVYPREIEEVLLEQPGVREAAVVGVPDERRGERPLAFYAGEAAAADLEAACRRQLASFKVPTAFVRVEALPRNALGKVTKSRLPVG
ncbi:MAG TPA: AMP-binding protein [Vicinamibacteria bacterium]|nr:AMP-binding protein [Vicinamibacteria bacterium]